VDEFSRVQRQCKPGKQGRAVNLVEEPVAPSTPIMEVDCTDTTVAEPNVPSTELNTNLIDLYSVGHTLVLKKWEAREDEVPFKQELQLNGPQGETVRVSALFDGGAMVRAMCSSVFWMIKHRLTGWGLSRRQL
jgi:hypothetical protein